MAPPGGKKRGGGGGARRARKEATAHEVLAYETTREHELKEAVERLTGSGVNKRA